MNLHRTKRDRAPVPRDRFPLVVIGGGASGILAAISAVRSGARVLIAEKKDALAKKVLVSGGGRCNIMNERLDHTAYAREAREIVDAVFAQFGRDPMIAFFKEMGIELYANEGRLFPVTDQAASVVRALELELGRIGVEVRRGCDIISFGCADGRFRVCARDGYEAEARAVIIAAGGRSYPALGSDGAAYTLAASFGHTTVAPVPGAVPLLVKDRLCHLLQGQRLRARVTAYIDGAAKAHANGDILFTAYGLSGTAIIDVSGPVSVALNRDGKKDVSLSVDFVPFMEEGALEAEITRRRSRSRAPEDLLVGIVPNKVGRAFAGLLQRGELEAARGIKKVEFRVLGTRGWNEAEFTIGGLPPREVKTATLESRLKEGLYMAGEMIDVGGRRGGYNLAWAWASGYVAGHAAAQRIRHAEGR